MGGKMVFQGHRFWADNGLHFQAAHEWIRDLWTEFCPKYRLVAFSSGGGGGGNFGPGAPPLYAFANKVCDDKHVFVVRTEANWPSTVEPRYL